jgi:large subunit ribosomal protein L5
MMRLQKKYLDEIVPKLQAKFNYTSTMQVPRLSKVVINMGVGDAAADSKKLDRAVEEITLITGQKPVVTKAKKSIASYKLREGQGIGVKVTLRNDIMWAFVDKLFNVALPRVRDFRGVPSKSFDGQGNYTLGIKEQIVFFEIDYDKVQKIRGFDITFVTNSKNDEQARELLEQLGMPFVKTRATVSQEKVAGK